MKRVAVVLSGCGVMDGSEIHESVLTMLALSKRGASIQCVAPNVNQHRVWNHKQNQDDKLTRNVLEESARIARGEIMDIKDAKVEDFDAVIFPGGYGAALNLCDFAIKGTDMSVHPEIVEFSRAMKNKPQGFMCIAPVMIGKIFNAPVKVTTGKDQGVSDAITQMGCEHIPANADEIVVDEKHKVVTTPAYMSGGSIAEISVGIDKLVERVLSLA